MRIRIWDLRTAQWTQQPAGVFGVRVHSEGDGTVFRLGTEWQILVVQELAGGPPWDEILCRRNQMERGWLIAHLKLFYDEAQHGPREVFYRSLNERDGSELPDLLMQFHAEHPRQGVVKTGRVAYLEV